MAAWGAKDVRLERRGDDLIEAMVATGSLVLRKVGQGRAGDTSGRTF